ncbi:MAG: SDR family NAD(P)-dependent oxidoreductase [Saprospiraceae bacterium]
MNQKTLTLAYSTDNQSFADTITADLQRVNYQIKSIPCSTAEGLQAAVANEQNAIILLISDNFLKSTDCMHQSLGTLRQLNEQKQFLPVIVDGQYVEDGAIKTVPTTFERVSNVIQYMNYWQDAYLALRREKRHADEVEGTAFEEKLKRVRTISSEVGEFLRYLRNTNYVDFTTLKNSHYEGIFRLVNDQTAFYEYKQLGATAVESEQEQVIETSIPTPPVVPTIETPIAVEVNTPETPIEEEISIAEVIEIAPEPPVETVIPAGALLVDELVEEEISDHASLPAEAIEKGIEAGASNGVLAAFHEGMEQTEEIVEIVEEPVEAEETLANFDVASIPGMDQITARTSETITAQAETASSNYSNGHTETNLEDLLGPATSIPSVVPSVSTNLEAIINETVAEENPEIIEIATTEEEEVIDINDIFAEPTPVEPVESTPIVNGSATIESLVSQQIEDLSDDSSSVETEISTEIEPELPATLEQMIGSDEEVSPEKEQIDLDGILAATEEAIASEAAAIEDPAPIEVVYDWSEMAIESAALGATLSNLPTDFAITSTPLPIRPEVAIAQAQEHIANGQIEDGIHLFQTTISRHSANTDLRYQYALALIEEQNDFAEAQHQLETLLTTDSNNVAAHFKLAELAEMQGEMVAAKANYTKVATLDPDYQQINYRLGMVNLTQPEDSNLEAAKYFKTAIQKDPQFADGYYQLALLLKNYAKKPAKAAKFFEKALQVDAKHPFAAYDLADTQQALGNHAEAAAAYAKAIVIHPDLRTDDKDKIYLPSELNEQSELIAAQEEIARLKAIIAERGTVAVQQTEQVPTQEKVTEPSKTILITGATSGIGRATAELFAQEGYRLIITGRRAERLAELKTRFADEYNNEIQTLHFDVRNMEAVKTALEQLDDEWRQIDILINNAGLASGFAPIHAGDLEDWERMIDTNLKGLLYMTRAITPHMVERRSGHVINIGSIAGKYAYPNGNVYNATKFAVDGLTQAMRLDLYPHNIRVSQVAPGHVEETEFALVRFHGDADRAKIYEDFKPITSSDVAETIYFIATRPAHVNVQDVLIMGTQQGGATFIDRSGR